ncbi:MAG TPA: cysteine hydrolase family protein [Gammaproteobacteria bacterium]|jgi:nicotinamidase-related amidase|nr:cysteine hydrolase family protein [Gammaproteobacteria bacterium]
MHPIPKNAALILIDIQQGFDDEQYWGPRNNPQAEANAAKLLAAWRQSGRPLFHIQHLSRTPGSRLAPGQPGCEHKPEVKPLPGETIIGKHMNSAFIGTDLEARLRAGDISTLVIAGLTTMHCVSTTVRMAGNLGFDTFVAADACAAHARTGYDGKRHDAQTVHEVALANLHGEFAEVAVAADILRALQT